MRCGNGYHHVTYLQISEKPLVVLQYGIHAVCDGNCMLPVVVGHAAIILLYRHSKSAQLLKFKATQNIIWSETRNKNRKNNQQRKKDSL